MTTQSNVQNEEAASTAATGEHCAAEQSQPFESTVDGAVAPGDETTRYGKALQAARELIRLTGSQAAAKQVIDHLGHG